MQVTQGSKIEGEAGQARPSDVSRELRMEHWEKGPEFSAEGLSISVLCAQGVVPLLAVSAKAGRFYYAEKVQGVPADVLDTQNIWLMNFLDRAKRKREQQDAFLWKRTTVSAG
ncbi:TPA: hypothetical protein L6A81_34635 [Pseudomonas aeruginosa]|nr:hypothetical protein [Pseudomonas aeruginosa]